MKEQEKTIAQQLNIKDFPFVIKDSRGNIIYLELPDGTWTRSEYDTAGNLTLYQDSTGFLEKRELTK